MNPKIAFTTISLLLLLFISSAGAVVAQTTSFTYQGRLTDGRSLANGNYDLQFALFDTEAGSAQLGVTGPESRFQKSSLQEGGSMNTAGTSARRFNLSGWAEAMGMKLVKTVGGYVIKLGGGMAPVQDLEGKVGDVISDGRWSFQVLGVQTAASYLMKTEAEPYDYANLSSFDSTKRIFTPRRGFTLIVIQCRVTNAQNSTQRLWTAISDNKVHTALVDTEGSSHPPIGYDFEGGATQSNWLAPGATLDFSVLFSVPQSARLKDLLFTLRNNSSFEKGNDARVSLSAEQTAGAAQADAGGDPGQKAKDVVSAPANTAATASPEYPVMNASSAGASPAPSSSSEPANMETNSARLGPKKPGVVRIGIVRPMAQLGAGGKAEADRASETVRNTFAEYLNGPTLEIVPLASRITAQALVEARQSECDYVLFTTLSLHRAGEGSNPFGKALGNIASSSAANIGDAAASNVARRSTTTASASAADASAADPTASSAVRPSAGSAIHSSARNAAVTGIQTATALASGIQDKDEFRLEYKLAPVSGAPAILAKTEKLKATTDGENLITRLVERASEAIGSAVIKK